MANLGKAKRGLLGKVTASDNEPARKLGKAVDAAANPSPNPMTNMVLADIALRSSGALLRRVLEKGLLGRAHSTGKAERIIKGRTMTQTLVGTAVARIATRSVPGALIVGGGLLAKTLYDRHRTRQAASDGAEALDKQAERGTD
ncbi:MAG: hypothetical protein V4579_03630 [Pseudomonadota bacterium]